MIHLKNASIQVTGKIEMVTAPVKRQIIFQPPLFHAERLIKNYTTAEVINNASYFGAARELEAPERV